jgi:hypothetical protein
MKTFIVLTFIWTLIGPLPPGIAINPQTKECGYFGYWEDEYATYHFPSPWEKHYGLSIQTETGSCQWDGSSSSAESCCQQLGYTYIGDAGEKYGLKLWTPYTLLLLLCNPLSLIVLVLTVIALLVFFGRKKPGPQPKITTDADRN